MLVFTGVSGEVRSPTNCVSQADQQLESLPSNSYNMKALLERGREMI